MPRANPRTVRQASHLTGFVYTPGGVLNNLDRMLTFVTSPDGESDKYWIVEMARRRVRGSKRADGAEAVEVGLKFHERTFAIDEYALKATFGPRTLRFQHSALQLMKRASTQLAQLIALEREYQVVSLLTTSGNFALTQALTQGFDDTVNGDPAGVFQGVRDDIDTAMQTRPAGAQLLCAMNVGTWESLQEHPDVTDRNKYTSAEPISEQLVAKRFGLDDIVVSRASATTAASDPETLDDPTAAARIWADATDNLVAALVTPSLNGTGDASFTSFGAFRTHNPTIRQYDPGAKYGSAAHGAAQSTEAEESWDVRIVAVDTVASGKCASAKFVSATLEAV